MTIEKIKSAIQTHNLVELKSHLDEALKNNKIDTLNKLKCPEHPVYIAWQFRSAEAILLLCAYRFEINLNVPNDLKYKKLLDHVASQCKHWEPDGKILVLLAALGAKFQNPITVNQTEYLYKKAFADYFHLSIPRQQETLAYLNTMFDLCLEYSLFHTMRKLLAYKIPSKPKPFKRDLTDKERETEELLNKYQEDSIKNNFTSFAERQRLIEASGLLDFSTVPQVDNLQAVIEKLAPDQRQAFEELVEENILQSTVCLKLIQLRDLRNKNSLGGEDKESLDEIEAALNHKRKEQDEKLAHDEKMLQRDDHIITVDDKINEDGNTRLHKFAANDNTKMIDNLLYLNANPLCKNNFNQTPAQYAVSQGAEVSKLSKLLEKSKEKPADLVSKPKFSSTDKNSKPNPSAVNSAYTAFEKGNKAMFTLFYKKFIPGDQKELQKKINDDEKFVAYLKGLNLNQE